VTGGVRGMPLLDFEAFGAAVGLALVCGALSVVLPFLISPTATLAALALAGWLSLARRRGSLTWSGLRSGPLAALCVLGGAGVGFLASPAFFAPFRGLLLAGSLVPLFAVERARSVLPGPTFPRA
jgi:hypothetical protein